jgi:serine/threonine-protein kinase
MADGAPPGGPLLGEGELRALAIRLATELAAAHRTGRLHLGLSPERIALPHAAITGFGGRQDLAYAAPEQVSHSGAIGPWTDVYSLGLVLLALASRAPPSTSTTIVGAIQARRKIPDLSPLPAELRAVVARMLEPDPGKRLRSMDEVRTALEGRAVAIRGKKTGLPRAPLWRAVAAIGSVALLVGAIWAWTPLFHPAAPAVVAFRPAVSVEERARRAIEASLIGVSCSWLDITYPTSAAGNVRVEARGVAAMPRAEIARRLEAAAGARVTADTGGVVSADPVSCGMLDALRPFREPSSETGRALEVKRTQFHLQTNLQTCQTNGVRQAQVVLDAHIGAGDFALFLIDAKGALRALYAGRAAFDAARAKDPDAAGDLGNGSYRLSFCTGETGTAGVLLVRGRGPFDVGSNPGAFSNRAWAQGWTTQMAWYQVVAD